MDGSGDAIYTTRATFDTPRGEYMVYTHNYPNGARNVYEHGDNQGVRPFIVNQYGSDGTLQRSDTTYNGFHRGDVGYEQLKERYETPTNRVSGNPNSQGQEPLWKRLAKQVLGDERAARIGIHKQGGYLRLQKQGGKLTEVWTPYN
jgi:hypothetical protein